MNDRERYLLGLRWEIVAEHIAQLTVDDGMQPLFDESIPVLLGLPHVDVRETPSPRSTAPL